MTMCAQIEFAWSKRVAKPTMQEHDCAVRLTFFLDMDDRWHLKVHGLIDQGDFRVPLNHTVRGGFREPEHSTCTCILHTLFRAFWGMCLRAGPASEFMAGCPETLSIQGENVPSSLVRFQQCSRVSCLAQLIPRGRGSGKGRPRCCCKLAQQLREGSAAGREHKEGRA